MSQFNKKGYRKSEIRKQVKHLNSFYNILDKLEDIYQNIKDLNVTIENLPEIASEKMGRELDNIELMVLRGKLGLEKEIKDEQEDNDTEHQ